MLPENHPYHDVIGRVLRPARYTGGEYLQTVKDPAGLRCRIALAYPDVYEIGMSHMGLKILYSIVSRREGLAAERVFAPWPDMEAELRRENLPLVSLETATPLSDFDMLGFSLQYELTYTNILLMLELGGIPRYAADRGEDDPLVIGGGPAAFAPEPVAPFFDLLLIGDGEEALPEMMELWAKLRDEGLPRDERIRRLAIARPGRYAPGLYKVEIQPATGLEAVLPPADSELPFPVTRAQVFDLEDWPFPVDTPVPSGHAIFDRQAIELARGCTEGCRFCQAGMIYRPLRERSPRQVIDTVMAGIREAGYDEVSLSCLSTADYSAIVPLVRELVRRLEGEQVSLAVSSLRAYGLPEELLDEIAKVRATSLTFAPEAGSQRMRDLINKNVTEEMILESARRVFSRNWNRMKLYFMIGLPTETDEDLLGIVEMGRRCREVGRRLPDRPRQAEVTCSVSSFVPKPHTPFQWVAMDSLEEIRRKQNLVQDVARRERIPVKWHEPEISHLEGVLSRGDRRLAALIERAYEKGARFDSWSDQFRFRIWREAMDELQIEPQSYLHALPTDAALPWDHLSPGVDRQFLLAEWNRSRAGRGTPPCSKPRGVLSHPETLEAAREALNVRLACYHCGVSCNMEAMKTERVAFHEQLEGMAGEVLERPTKDARRYRVVYRKTGPATGIGHLNLLKLWPRLLRRAGLPVAYSQGFHPHPRLSFTPALPMGMESDGEQVELLLRCEHADGEIRERLARLMPEGLEILEVHSGEATPLSKRLRNFKMRVAFEGGPANLGAACAELLSRKSLLVERVRKGRLRSLEVRPTLLGLEPAGEGEVLVTLALQGAAMKAADLVAQLGGDPASCRARRLGFDLE